MDEINEIFFLKLTELDNLALMCYEHYLASGPENKLWFNLDELFHIVELNFEKILDKDIFKKTLSIFHYTIQRSTINEEIVQNGSKFINRITQKYLHEEKCLTLVFEFLHQFLLTVSISPRNSLKTSPNFDIINVYSDSKLIRQRSRICLELLVNIYPNHKLLMKFIDYNNVYFGELFTHFIGHLLKEEHLYKTKHFWKVCLRNLLNDNRKFAIYWLKILIQEIQSTQPDSFDVPYFFIWTESESKEIIGSWSLFLTILESLDGKQSHLILPSLEHFKNLKIFGIWNQFIICEMMKHTNTLVLKWATRFVLNYYTCDDFDCLDKYLDNYKSLGIVVEAFNNTFLYNGADGLRPNDFTKFIEKNPLKFIVALVDINWKSIPLLVLLQSLNNINSDERSVKIGVSKKPNESFENLFKLAGKIRRTESKIIRAEIRTIFFEKFENQIQFLTANNFFTLMELLYNDNEEKSEKDIIFLLSKIKGMDLDNVKISFEFLKCLLVQLSTFEEDIIYKIHNNILLNCSLNDMLKILPVANLSFKKNLIAAIEFKLSHNVNDLKDSKDIKFVKMYLQLCEFTDCNFNIDSAYNLVMDDFKNVGKTNIKNNINFCILKQIFADLVAKKVFELFERKLSESKDATKSLDVEETLVFDKNLDFDVEILLSKGSFETMNEFLKRMFLMKRFLCFDHKVKKKHFNLQLYKAISQEISISSKKFGFKYVKKALVNLINFVLPDFPNILNLILDIDQCNFEYYNVVFSTVLEHKIDLNSSEKNFYSSENGFNFLLRGLMFGEPLLGENRIQYEYLIKKKLPLGLASSVRIRLLAAKLTQYLVCNKFSLQDVLLIRDKMLTESENLNNRKSRYFKNSKQHKFKLRIVQALTILSSNLPILKDNMWTDRYLKIIFEENNQTDVNYILELLIAKTIPLSKLIYLLENSSNLSNSGIISLFAICFIYCYNYVKKNEIELVKSIIKKILPWTMGQNFHIRLYAQITIHNLIKSFKLLDYYFLSETILESLKQGTAEKNYKKLNHDFRFQEPNLEELLNLHVIYYAIPRLNHTDIDEWFDQNFEDNYSNMFDEFYEKEIVEPHEELLNNIENVQRKINPIVLDESCIIFSNNSMESTKKDTNMIVVASLVDKLPNLGGIARTCEVLGIKQLAISSLKYMETKEFRGLSMTAEKWLNLFELKPINIQNYLLQMKSSGYEIIGAEQTANSENFVDFHFPKKTVLLLGHEKEGIPANLIALLDHAVEIPQFGMVRSLNVHVTGAFFMWEYCKQHTIKK